MNQDPKRPLFWHQGLFLQPQHFQQLDLYFQGLLSPLASAPTPFFWGVNRLEIQAAALQQRVFEIQKTEIIFPDFTWTAVPGNAVVSSRSFADVAFTEMDKPFRVFLGLRKWNASGGNVTDATPPNDFFSLGTRYLCPPDPENTTDLHADGPAASVRFMNHVLKIFWETESEGLGDYWLIPIAQLVLDGTDVRLSREFIPPVFTIGGSIDLLNMIKGMTEQITGRGRALESYKLSRDVQPSGTESSYLRYQMALMVLNRYIPLLHHMVTTPVSHPWTVYGVLRQLVGELSAFTDRIDALGRLMDGSALLPAYDHHGLSGCFKDAGTLIGELLSAIIVGGENVVHLSREGSQFVGHIPVDVLTERNMFCLVIKTTAPPDPVVNALQHIAKVGSSEEMPTLLSRALPGVPLDHRPTPPPGIPKRPDSLFFMMDRGHPQWQEIKRTGNICLNWDDAPEDATAQIVISPV
ncbi:MAG: type VI secretion system baseplate subunit TssK [Pseudomonadota bacterium]